MLRVGNFFVSISVEGFEEANDGRRGQGHFYSGANIREKSFLECLQQPLFRLYRKG